MTRPKPISPAASAAPRSRSTRSRRTSAARHATLDWSCSLLAAEELALLARLSVFAGSFDLAAVEAVCASADTPAAGADPTALPGALVDHSLVQRSGLRDRFGGALRAAIDAPMWLCDRPGHEQRVASARAIAGDRAFDDAWDAGRALAWEQAVDEALGALQ